LEGLDALWVIVEAVFITKSRAVMHHEKTGFHLGYE
jgi:hypothetical protein